MKDDPVLSSTLYVRNVSIHVTLERLREHFESYGRIVDTRLVKHTDTGASAVMCECLATEAFTSQARTKALHSLSTIRRNAPRPPWLGPRYGLYAAAPYASLLATGFRTLSSVGDKSSWNFLKRLPPVPGRLVRPVSGN